ncbi:hypothetical protein D9615_000047 [Tricholomella constricta]|uniref:Pentatricopeptide repeat protein n=1 Tax=Tricholomella constricta TaxID=117010 RepID=A0A8H5HQT9_9AGAR|nr:hypothetical protein D9615_000047 [Tricholomella constricta]
MRRAVPQKRAPAYSRDGNAGRLPDTKLTTKVVLTRHPSPSSVLDGEQQTGGSSDQTADTPQASTSSLEPRVAAFELPPPAQRKARLFLGHPNRRGARGLGINVPGGFERLTHRQTSKPPSDPPKSAPPKFCHNKRATSIKASSHTLKTQGSQKEKEQQQHYISESPSYQAGLPWRPLPLPPTSLPPLPPPSNDLERARHGWIHTLQTTNSAADGWAAYTSLLAHTRPDSQKKVYFALLHRLVRLLTRHRPTTHTEYMRLLAVLTTLRAAGGTVHVHEWNALIDAAGKGVRRTGVVQYEAALSFFRDMTQGNAPGTTLEFGGHGRDRGREEIEGYGQGEVDGSRAEPLVPDLYTYTTLISIASRTGDAQCMRHARTLLERSGIAPNRFTHLALTKYFSATRQPAAMRSTLLRIEQQDLELGLDGINACLVAYSYNNRLDVVMMVYRLLRHNADPQADEDQDSLEEARRQLRQEEYIVVPLHLRPNEITYTSMIQIMAYHGHLTATLTVFVDMISALNIEQGAPLVRDANGRLVPTTYQPTLAVFRAIFLGFRRHGLKLPKSGLAPPHLRATNPPNMPGWTLNNLEKIFEAFMGMPPDMQIGPSVFYWVVVAFQKASADDVELVRRVWKRVEGRFKGSLGGSNNRLRRLRVSLFPEEQQIDEPSSRKENRSSQSHI